jgi:cbb3-type cytochrome oxidase subunit 3
MRLTDIMSSMGLASYAEFALVLFLFAFLIIAVQLLFVRRSEVDAAAALPLDDGELVAKNQNGRRV